MNTLPLPEAKGSTSKESDQCEIIIEARDKVSTGKNATMLIDVRDLPTLNAYSETLLTEMLPDGSE